MKDIPFKVYQRRPRRRSYEVFLSHPNAKVTFYELHLTLYTFANGQIANADDDLEPEPQTELTVWCPDCGLETHYQEYRHAPEAVQALYQAIWKRDFAPTEEEPWTFVV